MKTQFVTADELVQSLGISKGKAYQIIRQLNDELSNGCGQKKYTGCDAGVNAYSTVHILPIVDFQMPALPFEEFVKDNAGMRM